MAVKSTDILKAAAKAKIEALKLQKCFDPSYPESRPNKAQWDFFKDINRIKFRYLVAGNGCLVKGTMVATPSGPTPIEDLRVGDTVYSEHGTPIKVLKVYDQGKKEVVEIKNRSTVWAEATDDHVWQVITPYQNIEEKKVSEFGRDDTIVRKELDLPLGPVSCDYTYSLGALLGDGCGTCGSNKTAVISSADPELVAEVTREIGSKSVKYRGNYSWGIELNKEVPLYHSWCRGRKAHEKIVDMDVVKSWDRKSLLRFVAGLIDSDGSISISYRSNKTATVRLGMQARTVLEAFQYALLALWQTPSRILVDDRDKYVNGPVYHIGVTSNAFTKRIIKELTPHLQCTRKQWKDEYEEFTHKRSTSDRVGQKLCQRRIAQTYDIHVDSPTNLYCLANGFVTHNSGKTATGGRELVWIITDTHPEWSMPEEWKSRSLQCLVVGKSRSILENEIWSKKIKPFFAAGEWKEVRAGNTLQYVEHRKLGHKIIFLSHSDGSQKAIDNLQAYDADVVWLDEMPAKQAVLEETQRRVRRPHTMWFATFTPKSISVKIRKQVEAAKEPVAKRYHMSRLDVPGVDVAKELLALEGLSNSQKRTILYGDWVTGDDHVYALDTEAHLVDLPSTYSKSWRHVECVDPGSNRGGMTIWGEDPKTKVWYCVLAQYIDGLRDPVAFYDACQEITAPYNIVRRICDPAATPHLGHAAARKCVPAYTFPWAKNQGRKEELIKNFQKHLSSGKLKLVLDATQDLADELSNMMRKDSGKIINSHAYHLADCCNYFADMVPKPESSMAHMSRDEYIMQEHDRMIAAEAKKANGPPKKPLSREQVHNRLMKIQTKGRRWQR